MKLSEVAEHPVIRAKFTAIAEAAGEAATPQIRNLGTVGGNILQRPRCWYFRNPDVLCLKKGGDTCYSIGGLNRYHAILGGGPSFIVHPSNLAPALIAMRASATIVGPSGHAQRRARKIFHAADGRSEARKFSQARRNNHRGDRARAVRRRRAAITSKRARSRASIGRWSASRSCSTRAGANTVRDARVVMGAVAPVPWRSLEAEAALKGGPLDESRARAAAEAALKDAQPMSDNAYKVVIAKVIVRRAIMHTAGLEAA